MRQTWRRINDHSSIRGQVPGVRRDGCRAGTYRGQLARSVHDDYGRVTADVDTGGRSHKDTVGGHGRQRHIVAGPRTHEYGTPPRPELSDRTGVVDVDCALRHCNASILINLGINARKEFVRTV